MKLAIALLATTFAIAPLAWASGELKPKHGGLVKEENEIQYELVAKPDSIAVYVEDHGKKIDMKGATGKVTLRNGADRSEATLAPAGDNKLEAKGSFKIGPGTTAIVQVKRDGKPEQSVRYSLK